MPDMTLAEFVLARITEQEESARKLMRFAQETYLRTREPRLLGREIPGWHAWPDVEAMCVRVLADCERDRRIAVEHFPHSSFPRSCGTCGRPGQSIGADWPCRTIRLMAAVDADHPDYDERWRP